MIVETAACISTSTMIPKTKRCCWSSGQAAFLFMHLLFQKMVTYPPTTLLEGHEDWKRRRICDWGEVGAR